MTGFVEIFECVFWDAFFWNRLCDKRDHFSSSFVREVPH